MLNGRKTVDGVSVLGPEYLILFKAKAWLDLKSKKAKGVHINERDLKKHKNDVFRLYAIVEPELRINLRPSVESDIKAFISFMSEENINLNDLGITDISVEEVLTGMGNIYSLGRDGVN